MSFSDKVVYGAAHVIYSSEFADALERRGGCFHGEITSQVDEATPAEHDEIIRPLLAKIDKALGAPLADIFVAGGIVTEAEQEDALGDLLMGVRGHGVSIEDSYREQWAAGRKALGVTADLPYDEMDQYSDLAHAKLDAAGYPEEPQDGEEPEEQHPIVEIAFSWHGGQESALYAFASTRMVQSETHRANTLDEIDADIAKAEIDDTREPGDLPDLRRLRKAVETAKLGETFFYV